MQRLVSKHRAQDGRINLQPKDAAKFVERAVADATAEALARAGMTAGDLRRLIIPRLATWDPQAGAEGAAKWQVASAADLFDGDLAALAKLADALVDQRLLTLTMTESGAVYEVAHEALLRVAPLGDLVFERRENFEQARVLKIEARDWFAAGQIESRLGRSGDRLKDADALLLDEDFGNDLKRSGQDIQAYVDACKNNERTQLDKQRRIIGRAFVKPALAALEDGLSEHALRLAAAGALLAEDAGLDLVPELWSPMAKAITMIRTGHVFKWHEKAVYVTAFSPDGKRVVTGSGDNTARLWDASTGAEIAVLNAHAGGIHAASFSPDGKCVVTGSDDNTARLWDASTGAEIAVLNAHTGGIHAASFSPDGKRVVTGSSDNTARLWDASTGAGIAVLNAHTGGIHAASFSPDGKRVVTGSGDYTAKIFDVSRSEAITRGRAHVLTAALAHGIGSRTDPERADLLMDGLPDDDMFGLALAKIGLTADDPELQEVIAALHAPLHPNCYLSPTQMAETFGLGDEASSAEGADGDDGVSSTDAAERDLGGQNAFQAERVNADDLVGQTYVETHQGVAIFQLRDGRYHVVSNFAVSTLDAALAAAEAIGVAVET